MEFKKLVEEFKRMCDSYSCEGCKSECAIYKKLNDPDMEQCEVWIMRNPKKSEKIISYWAKKHPRRTYLSELLERYPNTLLGPNRTPLNMCPSKLGLEELKSCRRPYYYPCKDCWNQEVKE